MLPVVASVNSFSFQTPLVNTTTPGTAVTRVPADNVAPSLSSAVVDDNSRGNSIIAVSDSDTQDVTAQSADVAAATTSRASVLSQSGSTLQNSGVQSAFIAQLAAQDDSPETQGALVQYEKLVANSNVKYLPSNALKPLPEPSNIFGKILQTEKASVPVTEPAPVQEPVAQPSVSTTAEIATEQAPIIVTTAQAEPTPRKSSDEETPAPTTDSQPQADSFATAAVSAYAATASRVGSFNGPSLELA